MYNASAKNAPYEGLNLPRVLLVLAFLAVGVWYLNWRITTINPAAPVFSWILLGAEIFGFFTALMHIFMTQRLTVREAPAAEAGHTVDVFIPTINEPVAVVRRTALTAMAMDYDHQTWILDDGHRSEIAQLAQQLGCGYISRTTNKDAKAGNLNHALALTKAEFIAVFDADHAPKRTFLTRTLGYFKDPEVAFVQTPQDFYNLDSYQHRRVQRKGRIWTEQSLFFRVIQRGKDFWNSAFFCGSCAIIRRSSLDAIGGFATGTVTEDLHTSMKLHKKGFRSVYHAESLAFGIAPTQIEPFIRQRIRWGQGAMQVWRKEGLLLSSKLTVAQKINYLASMVTYFEGWQKFVFYTAPAVVLFTGILPINTVTSDFFLHFVPYLLLTFWLFEEVGRGYSNTLQVEQYNMARFAAFSWATLGLFKKNLKFRVTNKNFVAIPHFNAYLVPQHLIFLANMIAIPLGALLYNYTHYLTGIGLGVTMAWASINLLLALSVLSFTKRRASFKRVDYRFAIPLAAQLPAGDEQIYAAVTDISSSGVRLSADFPGNVREGESFDGMIYLPDGPLHFRGVYNQTPSPRREGTSTNMQSIGCRFVGLTGEELRRLELFLYGSDLEWHIHHLRERFPTVIERLSAKFGDSDALFTIPAPSYWSTALTKGNGADMSGLHSGVISSHTHGHARSLMMFNPLEVGQPVETTVFGRDGAKILRARVTEEKRLDNPVASIYLYQLDHGLMTEH